MPNTTKDDPRTLIPLNNANVDIRTKMKVLEWIEDAKITKGTLLDRLVIFATRNGFDPRTASDDWEGKEVKK